MRIFLLVGRRVGRLHRTAIHHLDRTALPLRAGRGALFGRPGGGGQNAFQTFLRQPLAGLDVSRGAIIHAPLALRAGQRLHLADDFTTGGAGLEHLPEKAFAGQAQGKEPLPAVGAFVRTGKQVNGNELGKVCGQLLEGALAQRAGGALPQSGEAGAEGGKEGCVHGTVILLAN